MDKDKPNSDLPHTSTEMLEAISEATTDSIFFKDLEGRYQFVNSAFSKFIGYTAAEIIGKSDADLYPAETARQFIDADRIVLASGMTRVFEGVAVGRDRTQLYMVTKGVLRNRAGEIVGLFGISHDMTSRQLV